MKFFTVIILLLLIINGVAQNNHIILQEEFNNNNNNWLIEADQTRILKLNNGAYSIQNKMEYNSVTSRINLPFNENRDFIIDCQITKKTGYNKKGYGLIWGRNKADYYGFYITGDGEFLVLKWEAGNRDFVVGMQMSEHIMKDDGTNKLSIQKMGNKQLYFINDSLVQTTDFLPFFGYEIGFANGGKLTMEVDYIHVKYIEEQISKPVITDNIILNETFENNQKSWPLGKIKGGLSDLREGNYCLTNKTNNPLYTAIVQEIDENKNFVISTHIIEYPGEKDDSYCIMWGADLSTNQYYAFRINTFYGSYEYYRIREKEVDKLIDYSFSSAIKTGKGESNKIDIKKVGNQYEFYINNSKINDFRYQPFFGDELGFITHFKHKIEVGSISVKYLSPSF